MPAYNVVSRKRKDGAMKFTKMNGAGIDSSRRAETLDLNEFAVIANELKKREV